ncbi:MAG: hypothetical protein BalsKO_15780 [Balneolaceae bacterium]
MKNIQIVFLVEDNPAYRLVSKVVLEKMGFLVMQFENGRKASELMNHVKPDLIISDIDMPEMNGFQFFKFVRTRFEKHEIPFLFISSTASEKKRTKASKLSTFEMLNKPVSPQLLERRINEILKSESEEIMIGKN